MTVRVTDEEYINQHADPRLLETMRQYDSYTLVAIAGPASGVYHPKEEGYPVIEIENRYSGGWQQDARAAAIKVLIERAQKLSPESEMCTFDQACALVAAVGAFPMLIRAKQIWGIAAELHGVFLTNTPLIIALGTAYDRLWQYGDMDKEIVRIMGANSFPTFAATRLFRSMVQAEVINHIPDPVQFATETKQMTSEERRRLHDEIVKYQDLIGAIITKVRHRNGVVDERDKKTISTATELLMRHATSGGTIQPDALGDSMPKEPNAKVLMYYLLSPAARAASRQTLIKGLPLEIVAVLDSLRVRTKTADEAVKAIEAGAVNIDDLAEKVFGILVNKPPVFVVDISGSMEPALQTLQAFVRLMERAGARSQRKLASSVVFFNNNVVIKPLDNLSGIKVGGSTALYPALAVAKRIAQITNTFLIVLTDWEHNHNIPDAIRNEVDDQKIKEVEEDLRQILHSRISDPPDLDYLNEFSISIVFGRRPVPRQYQWDIIQAGPDPNKTAIALARLLREKYTNPITDVKIEPGRITVSIV